MTREKLYDDAGGTVREVGKKSRESVVWELWAVASEMSSPQ